MKNTKKNKSSKKNNNIDDLKDFILSVQNDAKSNDKTFQPERLKYMREKSGQINYGLIG